MTYKSNLNQPKLSHPFDAFWQATLIKITPKIITPNLLSLARLVLIPVVLGLIFTRHYPAGLLLFLLIALTDSFDGALARYRRQITDLGLILDPLADKLLIIGTLTFLLINYPFPELILYLVIFELIILIVGYTKIKILKLPAFPSNRWGKLKMTCQSLSTIVIFLWLIFPNSFLLYLSAYSLLLALLFLILSTIKPRNI